MQPAWVHTFENAAYPPTVYSSRTWSLYADSSKRTSSVGASSTPGRGSGNTVSCSPGAMRSSAIRSPASSTRGIPASYTGP